MSDENPVSVDILLARASGAIRDGRADTYCLPLLPLLEHPWSTAANELPECLGRFKEFEKNDLVAEDVVIFGLCESSQYWVGLALGWIEDGFPVSARIKEALDLVSQRKHLPQRERHTAWRLFHKDA